MNPKYKILKKQKFIKGYSSLVPIRMEDRYKIMKWRNQQLFHLRQNELLTKTMQDSYFENVVSKLFNQDNPSQLLFSYIQEHICIGYGGLVHINWNDRNAEISFVLKTEIDKEQFVNEWSNYLELIEEIGFGELQFHKLYVYAFDVRPILYEVLKRNGYFFDSRLKEHHFHDGSFVDVVIHSKINQN